MEIKKYSYENIGSKIAATVLIVLSVVCSIATAIMAMSLYQPVWFWVLLAATILLAIVSLVLSMVSIFASPKLMTVASIFVALTQFAALSMCLYVMAKGSLFKPVDTWITVVIFAAMLLIFVACWVSFIVVRAQFVANPNKKKGFRCAAIILTVIACLLVGAEITSGITGQNKLYDIQTYYAERIDVETQMSNDGITVSDYDTIYHYDYASSTEYAALYDVKSNVYYYNMSVSLDNVVSDTMDIFRSRGLLTATESPQVVYYGQLDSISISDVSQLKDKYLIVLDEYYHYNIILATQQKVYHTIYKTARQVFDEEHPRINLDKSSIYAIDYNIDYPYEDGTMLRVGRVRSVVRVPNVFMCVMSLCGIVALWLLTERCPIVETVIVKEKPKSRINQATADGSVTGDSNGDGANAVKGTFDDIVCQNVALNIFLTLITFGIYGFVWFYRTAQNVRRISGKSILGCGDEVLLYIIGGPIYRIYWYHTRAKQVQSSLSNLGLSNKILSPKLYLILSICTGGLFTLSVMTTEFNKLYAYSQGDIEEISAPNKDQLSKLSERRSLLQVVLLGIVTFGIYTIITNVHIANNVKRLQGKQAASAGQLICMMLVPFYWIIWLVKNKGLYHEGSNEATLEAWLMLVVPLYSTYWLISRTVEMREGAVRLGVDISDESVWTTLMAVFAPFLAYDIMLVNLNKVADNIDVAPQSVNPAQAQ